MFKNIVIKLLRDIANKLDAGTSEISEEDALAIVDSLANITINKQEAADRLNISERTFDRKIQEGQIPNGIKVYKETKLKWRLKDIIKIKENGYN